MACLSEVHNFVCLFVCLFEACLSEAQKLVTCAFKKWFLRATFGMYRKKENMSKRHFHADFEVNLIVAFLYVMSCNRNNYSSASQPNK